VRNSNRNSVIITSALPYANGEIHLGHISSTYLPADIFRRFLKLNGVEVYHLCASDDFGTPVLIETEKKRTKPELYVKYWHDKDIDDFNSVGIVFDSFSQTSSETNKMFVQYVFNVLKKGGLFMKRKLYNIIAKKI
jgi:methionyl-tRNA synthetase